MIELTELLYPLGLFNQRAASLVRFSQRYIDLGWPRLASSSCTTLPTDALPPLRNPLPESLDVKIFHGAGTYASDSFRIYSDLLPGRGGPEMEGKWLEKRTRAVGRMRPVNAGEMGVDEVGEWLSDEDAEEGGDEWRSVRPKGEGFASLTWNPVLMGGLGCR